MNTRYTRNSGETLGAGSLYMALALLCCLPLLLSRCAPSYLSPGFDDMRYVEGYRTHLVNDSLSLHLRAPADIRFIRDKDAVRKRVRSLDAGHLSGVIAYGETTLPPHYSLLLMLDPESPIRTQDTSESVRDTLLDDQRLVLLCRSAEGAPSDVHEQDCRQIFESIRTGRTYRENLVSIFDLSDRYGGQYYRALNEILAYPAGSRSEEDLRQQMALNYASFLAPDPVYDSLLTRTLRTPLDTSLARVVRSAETNTTNEVRSTLLEEAAGHRIIMFNENHFFPQHRMLLQAMLPPLKKAGFELLALEALGEGQDSLLNQGRPPTVETGFYTRDPRYASLLREAQELGYRFVAYENTDPDRDREAGQAANLYQRTLAENDTSRVVVLAGLDHILERPTESGRSWLAHRLHSRYGVDPLTVSQSHLNRYRHLVDSLALLPGSRLDRYELASIDWLLVNNLPLEDREPNFSYTNGRSQRVQVSVYLRRERMDGYRFQDLVPLRSTLAGERETVRFRLPRGSHYLVVRSGEGRILEEGWTEPVR